MSWISKLYETYRYCEPLIGQAETETSPILMPIAHTTQNAHIELSIDTDGNYIASTARVIESKQDSVTIIPCTEASQSRTSGPVPHPLFDKLMYVAGDYAKYAGQNDGTTYSEYIAQLEKWNNSPYSDCIVNAIFTYLKKGCIIADLIHDGIIPVDDDGNVIKEWNSKTLGEKRGVFRAGSPIKESLDAFVRINVHTPGKDDEKKSWESEKLWEDFIGFYSSQMSDGALCYVTGETVPCARMSPGKIRSTADKAKLISANDSSGFTYKGRFVDDAQTYGIGYSVTQEAHNALKWLISKQGFRTGEQVYVIWGTKNEPIPPIDINSQNVFDVLPSDENERPYVESEYALRVNKMLAGYRQKLNDRSDVVIMGLDSATTGRLSITYYQELSGSDFLGRLSSWYSSCAWRLTYYKSDGKNAAYISTPSVSDIIFAAYGRNAGDKYKESAERRLYPCVTDSAALPSDLVAAAARRASQPELFDNNSCFFGYDYRKTLETACAIIKKYNNDKNKKDRSEYTVALDCNNRERSYLFGRVLAYYHYIEYIALRDNSTDRATNAMRLQSAYCRRPKKTLAILDDKVHPYIVRMGNRLNKAQSELQAVLSELDGNNCEKMTDEPLDATYLLGYSSQLNELFEKKENK